MKTFGKILICIIVVLAAIGIGYLAYDGIEGSINTSTGGNTNSSSTSNQNETNNTANNTLNNTTNETNNNTDKEDEFIGREENNEEEQQENNEPEETNTEQEQGKGQETQELTGKDKAIDIVKKQYAIDGQTVRFDHMEGNDYIIKINDGTAVTWYLVNGTTWEAEEY